MAEREQREDDRERAHADALADHLRRQEQSFDDLAVPVGVFTGLAIFVPYVGFGIGLVLALLAGALQFTGWYGPIAVFVVYGIGQIVEGLFLTPKMVGERIGMSPLTVIFALFAFGHLFGFVGVLIALPASALIAVAAARLRASYTQSSLYTG
jgi:predicted PurR-regulated permease PerM